jgi:hypothetical protein
VKTISTTFESEQEEGSRKDEEGEEGRVCARPRGKEVID